MSTLREQIARIIAETAIGYRLYDLMADKREWIDRQGQKNGYTRDVNDPFQSDVYEAVDAILALALRSQSEGSSQEQLRAKDEEIERLKGEVEGLKRALAGAGSKIEVAISCLGETRLNPAGYLTDAALWLDRAGSLIRDALRTASGADSAASLHGEAPEAAGSGKGEPTSIEPPPGFDDWGRQ